MRSPTQFRTAPPITWTCRRRPRRYGKPASGRWESSPQVSCPAKAGHPVHTSRATITGSPAFAGDDGTDLLRLRNELDVHVGLQALNAAFGAVARFLDAAERRLRSRDGDAVDTNHA